MKLDRDFLDKTLDEDLVVLVSGLSDSRVAIALSPDLMAAIGAIAEEIETLSEYQDIDVNLSRSEAGNYRIIVTDGRVQKSKGSDLHEFVEPACRYCGCTWSNPCAGGCYWSAPGICSVCWKKKGVLDNPPRDRPIMARFESGGSWDLVEWTNPGGWIFLEKRDELEMGIDPIEWRPV